MKAVNGVMILAIFMAGAGAEAGLIRPGSAVADGKVAGPSSGWGWAVADAKMPRAAAMPMPRLVIDLNAAKKK